MWPRLLTPLGTLDPITGSQGAKQALTTSSHGAQDTTSLLAHGRSPGPLAPTQSGTVLTFFFFKCKKHPQDANQSKETQATYKNQTQEALHCMSTGIYQACTRTTTPTSTAATPHLHLNHPRHFFVSFVTEGHFEIKQRNKRQGAQQQGQQLAQWDDERSRGLCKGLAPLSSSAQETKPSCARGQGHSVTLEPFWPSTRHTQPQHGQTDGHTHTHTCRKTPTAAVWLQPLSPM